MGANALFTIYPEEIHNYSNAYFQSFFEQNRRARPPVIPPKPRHRKVAFPQVFVDDG